MIQDLLKITRLVHQFQQIKRVTHATGEDRLENDAEHSFQLALAAWYIIEKDKLPLRVDLAIKYALAHDLVELHAGDTYVFDENVDKLQSKKERELAAAMKLADDLPEFRELHQIIQDYENLADDEAKFVYALDKLLPPLNHYLDSGRSWKVHNINLMQVKTKKEEQIPVSPVVLEYWYQLYTLLEEDEERLFG